MLHRVEDVEHVNVDVIGFSCNLNFIAGWVESDCLVDGPAATVLFLVERKTGLESVDDLFTGQAVLERGSANSDVLEE